MHFEGARRGEWGAPEYGISDDICSRSPDFQLITPFVTASGGDCRNPIQLRNSIGRAVVEKCRADAVAASVPHRRDLVGLHAEAVEHLHASAQIRAAVAEARIAIPLQA